MAWLDPKVVHFLTLLLIIVCNVSRIKLLWFVAFSFCFFFCWMTVRHFKISRLAVRSRTKFLVTKVTRTKRIRFKILPENFVSKVVRLSLRPSDAFAIFHSSSQLVNLVLATKTEQPFLASSRSSPFKITNSINSYSSNCAWMYLTVAVFFFCVTLFHQIVVKAVNRTCSHSIWKYGIQCRKY